MTIINRRAALGGLGLALTFPHFVHAQAADRTVRFATQWVWQADHAIWTVAQKRGYFSDRGLNVVVDRGFGSADNMTKLAAGSLDVAIADINLLPKFNHQNPENQLICIMALFDAAPSAVLFLKSSGIETLKDLEGKNVAVTDADATTILFPIIAERNGVDVSRISFQSVASDLRDTLVVQGSADASLGYINTAVINWQTMGHSTGEIGFFQYNKLGLDLYSLGLVCRKDYAEENGDTLRDFLAAAIQGTREMLAEPEFAMQTIKERDPLVNIEVELERLRLIREIALVTPNVQKNGISSVDPDRLRETMNVIAPAMGVPAPEVETYYTDEFLPPKEERKII